MLLVKRIIVIMYAKNCKNISLNLLNLFRKKCRLFFRTRCLLSYTHRQGTVDRYTTV